MNYTIVSLTDVQGTIELDLVKDGNKYVVDFWDKECKEFADRTFSSIDDAWDCFKEVAEAVAKGLFSTETKIKILRGDI